jgi:VIT1/CCC1 family predicted Fe2+/Mn2+ transporter
MAIINHGAIYRASGLEMTWIGIIVAVVTYGLGLAFGALG